MKKKRIYKRYKTQKKGGQRYWKNYGSTFPKYGHIIKIGSKPGSPLSEKDIESELDKLPEEEFKKIKRVNIAPAWDYARVAKKESIPIQFDSDHGLGFVRVKRPKDVYVVHRDKDAIKSIKRAYGKTVPKCSKNKYIEVLQHEIGHSLTNDKTKQIQQKAFDQLKLIRHDEMRDVMNRDAMRKIENLAHNKREERFL